MKASPNAPVAMIVAGRGHFPAAEAVALVEIRGDRVLVDQGVLGRISAAPAAPVDSRTGAGLGEVADFAGQSRVGAARRSGGTITAIGVSVHRSSHARLS